MTQELITEPRVRLSRDRLLETAVTLADEIGIEPLSMRRLAAELGVVPMALYKHVQNKDELLDGMVEVILRRIDPPTPNADWKTAARLRVLSARRAVRSHPWARRVVESRVTKTSAVLDYIESFTGIFLSGGLSVDLTHHAMHALAGRMWGFTQELFDDEASDAVEIPAELSEAMARQMSERYPNIVTVATSMNHDSGSVVGSGCDDQFEFEFALDILLDGFERLHERGWTSRRAS